MMPEVYMFIGAVCAFVKSSVVDYFNRRMFNVVSRSIDVILFI